MYRLVNSIAAFFVPACFLAAGIAFADYPVAWTRTPSTANANCASAVAMDSAGNVYACGQADGVVLGTTTGGIRAYIAKYDPAGSLLWDHVWSSDGGASGAAIDGAGNVYVSEAGSATGAVWKFDSTGNTLWHTAVPLDGRDIAVDGSGNAYVTGAIYHNDMGSAGVSKVDSTGKVVWTSSLNTNGSFGNSIATDAAGNVAISGLINYTSPAFSTNGLAALLDAQGTLKWNKVYGTAGTNGGGTGDIAINDLDEILLTVDGRPFNSPSSVLVKYNLTGNEQWHESIGYGGFSLAIDPSGREFVQTSDNLLTCDRSGTVLNTMPWATYPSNVRELAYGNGQLGVAGYTLGDQGYNTYVSCWVVPEPSTIALLLGAALGSLVWWRRSR
jgi:hypothetical protein